MIGEMSESEIRKACLEFPDSLSIIKIRPRIKTGECESVKCWNVCVSNCVWHQGQVPAGPCWVQFSQAALKRKGTRVL